MPMLGDISQVENIYLACGYTDMRQSIDEADPKAQEPTLEEVNQVRSKKYKGQRNEKLDKLQHDKILFELEPEDLTCPQCGTELKPVGEEVCKNRS